MSDVIQLLPDSVANQIAAGEVIQRPASIIKELVENAVDAGATRIDVNVIDAGKTSVQVIDNGRGMSETDARLAPEILQAIEASVPLQRLAQPEEIAAAVAYLLSPAAAYITGETLSINGGLYMH